MKTAGTLRQWRDGCQSFIAETELEDGRHQQNSQGAPGNSLLSVTIGLLVGIDEGSSELAAEAFFEQTRSPVLVVYQPTHSVFSHWLTIFLAAILLAVVLNYCLNFPRAKQIITTRPWLREASYLIAGAWGIMLATVLLTTPPMSPLRGQLISLSVGLIVGGYLLLTVISVLHSYVKATAEKRSRTGLNLMLLGIVIGIGPTVVSILIHTLFSHIGDLPGERFWGITALVIPIGLAMALMKLEPVPAAIKREETTAT